MQKRNEGKVYKFTIDLINVANDKVKVELIAPTILAETITYHIPKIVPGTYSEDDYGRYIEQFNAYDKKGNTLQVVKSDVNSWTIFNATKLYKIDYLVNDSYDDSVTFPIIKYNVLTFDNNANSEQLVLRDAWLKPQS